MRFSLLVFLGFALGISHNSAFARPKQVELTWGQLAPLLVGQRVSMVMPEGIRIKGEVLSVRDDGLLMNIRKTGNKKAYAKGQALIPRAHVSLIERRRRRGERYRALLTPVGFLLSATAGAFVATDFGRRHEPSAASQAAGWAMAIAGTIGGYFWGKRLDTEVMHIKVAGDPPETETTFNSPAQEANHSGG